MHKAIPRWLVAAWLAAAAFSALAQGDASSGSAPQTFPLGTQPVPAGRAPVPADAAPAATGTAPAIAGTVPAKDSHIALLLPLKSKSLAGAAEAVQQGVLAAAAAEPDLPVKTYAVGDAADEVLKAYQDAVQAGARVLIGPLGRVAASALLPPLGTRIPTLMLNPPEGAPPPGSLVFWLSAEAEARQLARIISASGNRHLAVVQADSAYARRVATAFSEEWLRQGGDVVTQLTFTTQQSSLGKLRSLLDGATLDALFLAADPAQARAVRPYLPSQVPVFATSQVYGGGPNPIADLDLNGLRLLDAPWLVQPEHPAVMAYLRPQASSHAVLERLYAIGIDAWRLALAMEHRQIVPGYALDGVTGRISLGPDGQLQREAVLAVFRQGEPVVE